MKQTFLLLGVLAATILTSCKDEENTQQAAPTPTYKAISIEKTNTTLIAEYPTTLEGVIDIEIRPKVDGYIEKIYVDEGQTVKKGQLLFKLETQSATQDAAAAKAQVNAAQVEVNRLIPLVERKIISQVQLETAKANLATTKSNYQSIIARIDYANIKSPVNGVIGTIPYRLGSYVNSQTAEPLTRISDISEIYAYFSVNEKQQLDIMMNAEGKNFQEKVNNMPAVKLLMSNGQEYSQAGKIETFSGQANAQTGSFNVRASFKNPEELLRSGSTGNILIPTDLTDVIIIPQNATMELQDKHLVYTIDKENKLKAVSVTLRAVPGGKYYVVDSGLNVNDKIIIEGVGIVPEGTLINPQIVSMNEETKSTTETEKTQK